MTRSRLLRCYRSGSGAVPALRGPGVAAGAPGRGLACLMAAPAAASAAALPAGLLTLAALLAAASAVVRQARPRPGAPAATPGPRSVGTAPEQER